MKKLIKLASFSMLAMGTFSSFVPLAQAEEVQAIVICPNGETIAGFGGTCSPTSTPSTSIPEPETLALLAAGLAGIVLVRRKKK